MGPPIKKPRSHAIGPPPGLDLPPSPLVPFSPSAPFFPPLLRPSRSPLPFPPFLPSPPPLSFFPPPISFSGPQCSKRTQFMPSSTLPPVSRFHHLPPRPAPPKPPDPFHRPSGTPFA
eukprot:13169121-Heterocapsa_arctica.AAC.1